MVTQGDRYVGEASDRPSKPRVWHVDPNCPPIAGIAVKLTPEHQDEIERFHGWLLRPCRLCAKAR